MIRPGSLEGGQQSACGRYPRHGLAYQNSVSLPDAAPHTGPAMVSLIFFVSAAVVLLVCLVVLILKNSAKKAPQALAINDLLPNHQHQFEEANHRLAEYEKMLTRIQSERRKFALDYLAELQTDFEHITDLLNRAAKFLPEISLGAEFERFWLAVNFRAGCRLTRLQIRLGLSPMSHLKALTAKVRLLADTADQFLNEIARERGLGVLQSDRNR